MKLTQETLDQVRPELPPLFEAHWQEVGRHRESLALAPNWPAYEQIEGAGLLRIVAAREAGALVGYVFFVLSPSLHYAPHSFAVADLVYLDPAHRRGLAGLRLLRFALELARADGAALVTFNCKLSKDFGILLARLGFEPAETLYTKALI